MSFFLAAVVKLIERLGPFLRGPAGLALADLILDAVEKWAEEQGQSNVLTLCGAIRFFGNIPDNDDVAAADAMAGAGCEYESRESVLAAIDDLEPAGD